MGKANGLFPCLLQRPFTCLKPITVAPLSLLWTGIKHKPCFPDLPSQSGWGAVMGKQLGNPLCNSSAVCDGDDTEGVDKTRVGGMPPVLCSHRAQLREIHVHQHQDAFLQTIQRPEAMILQNSPHPHESQDKGASGFGLCYLVCTLF